MRQAQAGVIDPHTVTEIDAILNMRAENKLGQQVGTPQAWQEVNKALDAHRAFDVEVNNRRMAAQEALQNANQFTRERLIPGGTIDPQWSKKRTNLQNNLAKALDTGTEQPVNFGKMSKKQFDETNKIFNEQGIPQLESRDLMVHPNVVKKLQEKRITTEGMTPEQIADVAYSAIHNKRSKVSDATNKSQSVRFATNKKTPILQITPLLVLMVMWGRSRVYIRLVPWFRTPHRSKVSVLHRPIKSVLPICSSPVAVRMLRLLIL